MHNDDAEQGGLRILVVDDNVDAAAMMSLLLEVSGHRTETANNGRDAVEEAKRSRYDAVLLDLEMPIMDGFEAAGLLGQLRPAPRLIACSGCDDVDARKRTSELGFFAHLTKPVPLALLEATLGKFHRAASGVSG